MSPQNTAWSDYFVYSGSEPWRLLLAEFELCSKSRGGGLSCNACSCDFGSIFRTLGVQSLHVDCDKDPRNLGALLLGCLLNMRFFWLNQDACLSHCGVNHASFACSFLLSKAHTISQNLAAAVGTSRPRREGNQKMGWRKRNYISGETPMETIFRKG